MLSPFSSLPRPNVDISRGLLLLTIEDEALDEESGTGGLCYSLRRTATRAWGTARSRARRPCSVSSSRGITSMLKRTSTVLFHLDRAAVFLPGLKPPPLNRFDCAGI